MLDYFCTPTLSLETIFTTDFLNIGYLAQEKYLEVKWKRPASSEEFREGMKAILDNVNLLGIELLLIDFSMMGTPSVSDQNWLIKLLISVNKTTPLKRSARLFSKDAFQHVVNEIITEKVEYFPYQVEVFVSEMSAKQWLFQKEHVMYK